MTRTTILTGLMSCVLVLGCGDDKPASTTAPNLTNNNDDDDDDDDSVGESGPGNSESGNNPTSNGPTPAEDTGKDETTNVSSMPTSATSTTGDPPDPVTSGTSAGETFIVPPDGGTPGECDVFGQDCPDGEKCAAYANDGGSSWNDTKCVPVNEDAAAVGDDCLAEGSGVSGLDNCEKGAMCWDTDAENKGYCVQLCTGSAEAPVCEESGFICAVVNKGVLNLCLPGCDPLQQDCPMDDDLCIPADSGFLCVLDASGEEGQVNDPCMYANACDKGLYCIGAANAMECDQAADGCCQPFCDLTEANMCEGSGQSCVPWYEDGTAPPGYENVGICAIPA